MTMTDTMYAQARKEIQADLHAMIESNDKDRERARLVTHYGSGNVWDTNELGKNFEVRGFAAPFCVVRRRVDGVDGTVGFQHRPRLYFGFEPYQAGR
jgi:hypothetical protein